MATFGAALGKLGVSAEREANLDVKEAVVADPDPIDVDVDVGADETGAAKPSNLGSQEFFLTLIGLLGVVMIIGAGVFVAHMQRRPDPQT